MFAPADTDCLRWERHTPRSGGGARQQQQPASSRPLYIGHQVCSKEGSAGNAAMSGVMGMQVCMSVDGTQIGHDNMYGQDGFDAKCRQYPLDGCWLPPHHAVTNYWRASFGSTNLTWTSYKTGDKVPTNAVMMNGPSSPNPRLAL